MDKIAVLIGNDGKTIAFSESGTLKVFLRQEEGWKVIDEISLSIDDTMGIKNVREKFLGIVKRLSDCHIVVGKKVDGIAYNSFEAMKINVWEFEGEPQTFLDYILEKEQAFARKEKEKSEEVATQDGHQEMSYIKKLSDRYYVIDLEELQSLNRNISSKQAIIPVLEKRAFKKLDILCTHIPPWMENQIENYQLKMETENLCSGSYKVSLSVK